MFRKSLPPPLPWRTVAPGRSAQWLIFLAVAVLCACVTPSAAWADFSAIPLVALVVFIPPVIGGLGDSNLTAAARNGTTITASGTAHVKGSYSTVIATTGKDSYGIWMFFKGVAGAAANTSMLVDVAYGDSPSGGNEQILINNLTVGAAAPGGLGLGYYFPVYIPSGVSIRMRCQAVIISDTVNVSVFLNQDPAYKWSCGSVTTYGADTATSNGTSVTPASGSFGTWTAIGGGSDPATAKKFWVLGYAIGTDTTVVTADVLIEIGTGPDSSNVSTIARFYIAQNSSEELQGPFPLIGYGVVASGQKLWARIASGEAEARRIIIYGCD